MSKTTEHNSFRQFCQAVEAGEEVTNDHVRPDGTWSCMYHRVVVRYDRHATIAATAPFFFSESERVDIRPKSGILAYVYFTEDESVLGRCAHVTCRDGSEKNDTTWYVTVADARVDIPRLVNIVRYFSYKMMDFDETRKTLGRIMRFESHATDTLCVRRDFDFMARCLMKHGLRDAISSWSGVEEKQPDLSALFARAPGPVETVAVTCGVASAITYAGGNIAVANLDKHVAHEVMREEAANQFSDAESTKLRAACATAGLGTDATSHAQVYILVSQDAHQLPGDDMVRFCTYTDEGSGRLYVLVAGVPVANMATAAYILYNRLVTWVDDDWQGTWFMADIKGSPSLSLIAHCEMARAERVRAVQIMVKYLEKNMGRTKARLWRPFGELATRACERAHASLRM